MDNSLTSSSESLGKSLEEEEEAEVPDADPFKISAMTLATNSFPESAPDLATLAGSNRQLQLIASNLQGLLSAPGYVKFSQESRREIDCAIRAFIFQACADARKDDKPSEAPAPSPEPAASAELIEQLTERVNSTQQLLKETQKKANSADLTINDMKNELTSLHAEYDTLFQEKASLLQKYNQSKRDIDLITTELKNKCDSMEEQLRAYKDKLKLSEFSCARHEKQMETMNQEFATLNSELIMTKSKLAAKTEKHESEKKRRHDVEVQLKKLDSDYQQMRLEMEEITRKNQELERLVEASNIDGLQRLEEENVKLRQAVNSLSELCQGQAEDISVIQQEKQAAIDLLHQQLDLIQEYDAIAGTMAQDKDDLDVTHENDLKMIEGLRLQIEKVEEELQWYKSDESQLSGPLRQMISDKYGDDADAETIIRNLIEGGTNEELKDQNSRLIGLIESMLVFVSKIVNSGELNMLLISPDGTYLPAGIDETFKGQILIEIARVRQFLAQNGLNTEEGPQIEPIKQQLERLARSDSRNDRELYSALASQVLISDCMRRLYDKIAAINNGAIAELQQVADFIGFAEPNTTDLPAAVAAKLLLLKESAERIADEVNDEQFNPESIDGIIEYLLEYLVKVTRVARQLDTDVRRVSDYQGDIEDMCPYLCEYVEELSREAELGKDRRFDEVQAELVELKQGLEEEKEKAASYIAELESKLSQKETEFDNLKDISDHQRKQLREYEELMENNKQRAAELEAKYKKFTETYEEMEEDVERLRQDNTKLRQMMEQKSRMFDERLERLFSEERQQHADDLQKAEERMKKREDSIKEELADRNKKIGQMKAKMKEIIETYEVAFKKQKEATAALRQQNETLSARVEKLTITPVSAAAKTMENLRAEIKSLSAEKQVLVTKLQQANDRADKTTTARDNYWMAQLAVRESELTKSFNQAASTANDRYDGFVDELASIVEPFLPRRGEVTEKVVLDTVQSIIQQLEELKAEDENRVTNDKAEPGPEDSKALQALQEWDRWGRDLFVNVTDGEVPCRSSKELRYILGEMVLTSIGHRRLIWRLESLRAQKKALTNGIAQVPSRGAPTMQSLMLVVVGAIRMMRKSGHFPKSWARPVAPTPKRERVSLF